MKILLMGSGAREHAIARAIARSQTPSQLYCVGTHRNPGIIAIAEHLEVGMDNENILAYAQKHAIDWTIVGPEAPLAAGVVDALAEVGIPAIGPSQQLAQIESSKGFTRDLMTQYQIPGQPLYRRFNGLNADINAYLKQMGEHYVIKDDGLCGGKGVKISGEHLQSHKEALEFCEAIDGPFVIEEKLIGPEFSLISFCDGTTSVAMPVVQDHKRAFVGDTGPNTGGMGSYSAADHRMPFLTETDIASAKVINQATVDALKDKFDENYIGFLYGGFMKTAQGVKLIEYNARLGDPESINLLALLESDFIEVCQAMLKGQLDKTEVQFAHKASVVKYIVPNGYPENPIRNEPIDATAVEREHCYFAAIDLQGDQHIMTGSRAIAVLGLGKDIASAEVEAEQMAQNVKGNVYYRPDIGKRAALERQMAKHADLTEG